ncbi:uncharacterized protein [Musca autumnalis]|uniref:uncharacterized protein n=1 Tax=Musca autumnalis TaxID=221902 RepID=UPI003CEACEDC
MSHLSTFIGIVQSFCEEDSEIEELLKETEELLNLQKLVEYEEGETERDHTRLQMDLYNVKLIMLPTDNNLPDESSIARTNQQLIESCVNIRYALSQIDYIKILQCKHMEMEQTWRKEWQKMQDYTVSILKGHQKMQDRHVVQKYRKVEVIWKGVKNNLETLQTTYGNTINESRQQLQTAKGKQKNLIISMAEALRDLGNLGRELQTLQEYSSKLETLNRKKFELNQQIQDIESKHLKLLMPYQSSVDFVAPDILRTFNGGMPKFPTFSEILSNFNQDFNKTEIKPEITVIENTTNITVKSILRNSQDNSMEINQSITTNHTKHVRFKVQLEEQFELNKYSDSAMSETTSEDSQDTTIENPNSTVQKSSPESETTQNTIPIIDLLTPLEESGKKESATKAVDIKSTTNKPKVDILECVVIKPPQEDLGNNKENIEPTNDIQNDVDKSNSVEELASSSSPNSISDTELPEPHTSRRAFKEFDYYLNKIYNFKPETSTKTNTKKEEPNHKEKSDSEEQQSFETQEDVTPQNVDIIGFDNDNFIMDSDIDIIGDNMPNIYDFL